MEKFWQEIGFIVIIAAVIALVFAFLTGNVPTFLTNTWNTVTGL